MELFGLFVVVSMEYITVVSQTLPFNSLSKMEPSTAASAVSTSDLQDEESSHFSTSTDLTNSNNIDSSTMGMAVTSGGNITRVLIQQPQWSIIMDDAQMGMTTIGFVTNIFTFLALGKSGHHFGATILLILKNQSVLDASSEK